MLTKKDKHVLAGFGVMALIGLSGSFYLLLFGGEGSTPDRSNQEAESAVVLDVDTYDANGALIMDDEDGHAHDEELPSKGLTFDEEGKTELDEEEGQELFLLARQLLLEQDHQGILDLLMPIVDQYNLTTKANQALAEVYSDANLMIVQATMTDPLERARVVTTTMGPEAMAYNAAHLPVDVFLYTTFDGNSVNVAEKGIIESLGEPVRHPVVVDEDSENDTERYNQTLMENPVISLFFEELEEFGDIEAIHELPMRVQGADVTAYVAEQTDQALMLIGYYLNDQATNGTRFQSVDWHLSHRQRLSDAIQTDWEQGGGEENETEVDELEEE